MKNVTHLQRSYRWAVETGNFKLALECQVQGADPDCYYPEGWGIYHIMAQSGKTRMAKKLFQRKKANLNIQTEHTKSTPLMLACQLNQEQFVKFLLKNGADPNLTNAHGRSSLHYCAKLGLTNLISYLIKAKSNVMTKDEFDNTPLTYSVVLNPNRVITEIIISLVEDLSDLETVFLESVLHCNTEERMQLTLFLLDYGVHIHSSHPISQQNCLHIVAQTNYCPLAKELLLLGADLDAQDCVRRLPSHLAKLHNNAEVLAIFQEFGYTGYERLSTARSSVWYLK